jgi:hypothetical protein
MTTSLWRVLALGIAGAMVGATPSSAAPVLSSTTAVKAAVADNVVDVRWRRGSGIAAGIAAGALAGAVIGAAVAPRYYYGPGYAYYPSYGYPAYGYGYPAYGYSSYGYPANGYSAYGYSAYGAPVVYGSPVYGAYGSSYAYPHTCGVYGGYGRWDYSNC